MYRNSKLVAYVNSEWQWLHEVCSKSSPLHTVIQLARRRVLALVLKDKMTLLWTSVAFLYGKIASTFLLCLPLLLVRTWVSLFVKSGRPLRGREVSYRHFNESGLWLHNPSSLLRAEVMYTILGEPEVDLLWQIEASTLWTFQVDSQVNFSKKAEIQTWIPIMT